TDPLDEASDENPPSHPELLDLLAKEVAAHQYDLRFLSLAITASKTYPRSSTQTHDSQKDPRLFARAVVRGLSGEQVVDSMARAVGHQRDTLGAFINDPERARFGMQARTLRGDFLGRFPHQARKPEAATSILQALFMMNSEVMEAM